MNPLPNSTRLERMVNRLQWQFDLFRMAHGREPHKPQELMSWIIQEWKMFVQDKGVSQTTYHTGHRRLKEFKLWLENKLTVDAVLSLKNNQS